MSPGQSWLDFGSGLTGRATLPEVSMVRPSVPSLITAPIGAVSFVAVTTVTESHRAARAESASPLKPKVVTLCKSSRDGSFDV